MFSKVLLNLGIVQSRDCVVWVHWLIEWCFTPLSTVFQSYHRDSSHNSCLSWPKDTPMKKPRGYSVARTQDPWITSQTLHHWATWDPWYRVKLLRYYLTLLTCLILRPIFPSPSLHATTSLKPCLISDRTIPALFPLIGATCMLFGLVWGIATCWLYKNKLYTQ